MKNSEIINRICVNASFRTAELLWLSKSMGVLTKPSWNEKSNRHEIQKIAEPRRDRRRLTLFRFCFHEKRTRLTASACDCLHRLTTKRTSTHQPRRFPSGTISRSPSTFDRRPSAWRG